MVGIAAQQLDTIRVGCTTNLVLAVPPEYGDTLYNYEEGFFRTFFWGNGDILDIQCGSMSEPIYLTDTVRFEKIQTCETKQRKTLTGIERRTGKYWGVMKFKRHRIIVSYICSSERRNLFEEVLQDIKIE